MFLSYVEENYFTLILLSDLFVYLTVCLSSVQPVNFSLCRRLPTEHVSGQLQFKVELTSTGPDGKSASKSHVQNVFSLKVFFFINMQPVFLLQGLHLILSLVFHL